MSSGGTWEPPPGTPTRHGWRTPVTAPGPRGAALLRSFGSMRREPLDYLNQVWTAHGDVVQFPIPSPPTYLVTSPRGVRHVLQDNHRSYGKRTIQYDALSLVTGEGLLTADTEAWRPMRRRVQPAFHHEAISPVAHHVSIAAQRLSTSWSASIGLHHSTIIDVDLAMMEATVDVVGASLFGADLSGDARELADATVEALDVVVARARMPLPIPAWLPTPNNVRLRRQVQTLDRCVSSLVQERRRVNGEDRSPDLLDLLLAEDSGGRLLSPEQVRNEVVTFLVAGHETVASALSWAFWLLAQSPHWTEQVRTEVDALGGQLTIDALPRLAMTRAVVNETLRLYPPAWVITRRALAEDVVAGHRIPQGALVVMSPWLVHRHPEAWDSPESFDPQRFLGDEGTSSAAYLPFGAGPRLCIGRDFALVEATLMLAHILRAFDVRAIPGHTPRAVASVTLRPEGGLPMLVSGGGAPSGRS